MMKNRKSNKPKDNIEVTVRRKILGEAPAEMHFKLADGRKVKSIFELIDVLDNMSDDIFRHHVNEFRNDFSSWVKDVFEEPALANDLIRANDRINAQVCLLKRLINELKEGKHEPD